MKIQLGITGPTDNKDFKRGHIYKHVNGAENENVYLCTHNYGGAYPYGKQLVLLNDGVSYPVDVKPEYFIDITDKVSLQDIKK